MKSKLHVVYIFLFPLFQCIKERIVLAMSGKALLRRFQRVPKRFVEDEGFTFLYDIVNRFIIRKGIACCC